MEKEVRANGDKRHQQIIITLVCAFDFQYRTFHPGVSPDLSFTKLLSLAPPLPGGKQSRVKEQEGPEET